MTEYEIRMLIWDLINNDPKLRELQQKGLITQKDVAQMQDTAVRMSQLD
jgi:hypothetical protein